ncbi:MAG: universal stress protein [Gammaproteobacteria bacterium]|nr:universal stress protein [Gammaproteobacteria bacterium]
MEDYRHILLATDFAPESHRVGARAVEIARRYDARLSLLHVVDYVPLELSNDMMLAEPVDVDGRLVEEARESLDRLAAELGQDDAQRWVVLGSTGAEIKRTAEEHDVDLIVVGSHGRHGLALLLGSTANSVLHGAPCDVLAVRVGADEA